MLYIYIYVSRFVANRKVPGDKARSELEAYS